MTVTEEVEDEELLVDNNIGDSLEEVKEVPPPRKDTRSQSKANGKQGEVS